MAANLLSNNMSSPSGSTTGNQTVDAVDQVSTQVRNQPVAILWDIENCPVPTEVHAEDVAKNIRGALQQHPVTKGAVKLFSVYANCFKYSRKREGLQRTGVKVIDVPRGNKGAADKAILVEAILADMLFFAFDNPPPYTILLISGYVDFAPALHKLGQRGYTVVLAIPSGVGVSRALSNAGQFVWYWRSIARGEGLVSAKSSLSRSFSSDDSNLSNDEEAVVHKGMPQNRYIVGTSSTQTCTINSTQIAPDLSRIQLAEPSANAVSYSDEGSFDETIALDMSRPRNRMRGRRGASRIWVARSRPSTSSDSETSYEGVEWGRYPDTGSHRGRASHPGMARAAQRSPPPFAALPLALVANSPERPVVSPGSAPPDLGKQPMQVDAGITSKDGEQKEDVEDPKEEPPSPAHAQ